MPLWKAALPWLLLVVLVIFISVPQVQEGLYNILGNAQKINVIANKTVDLKLMNQAYFWVVVSTLIAAPLLIRSRAEGLNITHTLDKTGIEPHTCGRDFFCDRLRNGLVRPDRHEQYPDIRFRVVRP